MGRRKTGGKLTGGKLTGGNLTGGKLTGGNLTGGNLLNKIDDAMPKEGIAKDIYEGTVSFGKIIATISLVLSWLFGILLFMLGIYVAVQPEDESKDQKTLSNQSFGLIMIGVSIFIVCAASIYYYFVNKYKVVAAIAGVDGIFDGIDLIT